MAELFDPLQLGFLCYHILMPLVGTTGDVVRDFFAEVRRPIFKANMSPVQISKPIMSVESAEVEAAQAPSQP